MFYRFAVEKCNDSVVSRLCVQLTLVSQHTSGRWMGTAESLSTHIREIFILLLPMCIDRGVANINTDCNAVDPS